MIKNKFFSFGIYTYIALPFMIFAIGFLKLPIAIAITICMLLSLFFATTASQTRFALPFKKTDIIKVMTVILFITAITLLSGIGNVFWQNNDHATRNTLFDILVNYSWPPSVTVNGESTGLIYYIGFWLPSALIGKLISIEAGYIFQIIWTVAGLLILWYLLCVIHRKIVIYPIIIFMLFSGLDVIGHGIITQINDNLSTLQIGSWAFSQGSSFSHHLEWWAGYFQYSSHTTQLFWVFNQCLPVWIATVVMILEKNNKNLVFIMGLTLLSSTLPFVGLIPIFVWCAVSNHKEGFFHRKFTRKPLRYFLSLFTYQNLIGGGISGIVTFLYLKGNIASGTQTSQASNTATPQGFSFSVFFMAIAVCIIIFTLLRTNASRKPSFFFLVPIIPLAYMMAKLPDYKLFYYVLFIILEVLVIAAAVYPIYGKTSLYAVVVSSLLIIPFFVVGKSIDFCMRASIPPLVIMSLFAIESLGIYIRKKQYVPLAILICILLLGSVNSFHEISRTIEATVYEIHTKGQVENDSKKIETVFKGRNFTGKTKDNFFFEYLAK